jgi:hypothetical protein
LPPTGVLVLRREREGPGRELVVDLLEAGHDLHALQRREHARPGQRVRPGDAAADVLGPQPPVEGQGGVELVGQRVGLIGEAPAP